MLANSFAMQLALSGDLGVDMFFVLSGFLIALQGVKELRRTGKIHYFGFLWARWWRIVPTYWAAIAINVMFDITEARDACSSSVWWNVLFVNNMQDHDLGLPGRAVCLMWTWSIGLEFQFYFLTPAVILMCCHRDGSLRRCAFLILLCLGAVFLAIRCAIYFTLSENGKPPLQMINVLWTRGHTYLAGVAACLAYYAKMGREPSVGYSVFYRICDLLAAIACVGIAFVGNGMDTKRLVTQFSPDLGVFLIVCSQGLFACAVAWGAFRATSGEAPWLDRILSAKILVPFARLSYSAYLMQMLAITPLMDHWNVLNPDNSYWMCLLMWILFFLSATSLVFLVALVHHLVIEAPSLNLRKDVTPRCLQR